jgi:hypothetical protein
MAKKKNTRVSLPPSKSVQQIISETLIGKYIFYKYKFYLIKDASLSGWSHEEEYYSDSGIDVWIDGEDENGKRENSINIDSYDQIYESKSL